MSILWFVSSYVPSIVKDTPPAEWNEKQKQQVANWNNYPFCVVSQKKVEGEIVFSVSHLNLELVHSLRATDSAFSSGESSLNVNCVKFGMLADEKDLDDLITLVAERGKSIEDSAQVTTVYFWNSQV